MKSKKQKGPHTWFLARLQMKSIFDILYFCNRQWIINLIKSGLILVDDVFYLISKMSSIINQMLLFILKRFVNKTTKMVETVIHRVPKQGASSSSNEEGNLFFSCVILTKLYNLYKVKKYSIHCNPICLTLR